MRTIKFRGWATEIKQWVYGGFVLGNYGSCGIMTQGMSHVFEWIKVDPESVGQYVGVINNTDQEVYEGDIVECKYYKDIKGIVTFNNSNAPELPAFHVCNTEGVSVNHYYGESPLSYSMSVVGNSYTPKV